jgi:hypothetical protein
MTRGRDANHAHVVTGQNATAADTLTQAIARDRMALTRFRGHVVSVVM